MQFCLPAFLLLSTFVATLACTSNNSIEQKERPVLTKFDTTSIKVDNDIALGRLNKSLSFLDSNIKYGRLSKEMEIKMAKAEANYYKTTDEKYYRQFYKYRNKQWYYVGLANKYDDSLKAQAVR